MIGELITLPLRATGLAARLSWRAAERTLSLASDVAGYVVVRVGPGRSNDHLAGQRTETAGAPSARPEPESSPTSSTPHATSTESLPPAQAPAQRVNEPQPVEPAEEPTGEPAGVPARQPAEEPTHVSEEPELVEAFAERGVEDGVGPELHIREPWDGYRHMNAREVTERLSGASAAELAAIQLYESSSRGRRSVLSAVERQLRAANGQRSRA